MAQRYKICFEAKLRFEGIHAEDIVDLITEDVKSAFQNAEKIEIICIG